MDRRRAICGFALAAPVLAGIFVACGDLKDATTSSDAGPTTTLPDGRVVTNRNDGAPIGLPDAGPPPADSVCDDAWIAPTKGTPGCEPRQVVEIDQGSLVNGISIAHTPAGRVAIAFNVDEPLGNSGEFHLAHFIATTSPPPPATILTVQTAPAIHDGYLSRVVGVAPDTVDVLTLDVDDQSQSGVLNAQRLENGAPALTPAEVALGNIHSPSEISYAVDPTTGTQYATARLAVDATKAKLAVVTRNATAWKQLPDIYPASLEPADAPGIGQASMFIDLNSQLHVLYNANFDTNESTPRYQFLALDQWSEPKTVDNTMADGLCGFSPSLVTNGNHKYALFFYRRPAPPNTGTAELRLATWDDDNKLPQVQVLEQDIPATDDLNPHYRAAMAIDKFGLLHIAVILPDPGETTGVLEYHRQFNDGNGLTWLVDQVDPQVSSKKIPGEVALVVDENARPHIAYVSGADEKIRYATRYDR